MMKNSALNFLIFLTLFFSSPSFSQEQTILEQSNQLGVKYEVFFKYLRTFYPKDGDDVCDSVLGYESAVCEIGVHQYCTSKDYALCRKECENFTSDTDQERCSFGCFAALKHDSCGNSGVPQIAGDLKNVAN